MQLARFNHLHHHGRFYFSVLCGFVVWLLPLPGVEDMPTALAGATFFAVYLASATLVARSLTTAALRKKAMIEDEGIVVIVLITLAVISLSLGSLALLLGSSEPGGWRLVPAIANVPLGWATLHTVMAFHYAHLFYAPSEETGESKREGGGLVFPKTREPAISDFVYFSFVVGMTTQVSDIQTTTREMRNNTLAHSVASFFFNTVILAFAVNVVAGG